MPQRPSEIAQPPEATSSRRPETTVDRNAFEQHLLQGDQAPSSPYQIIEDDILKATQKALDLKEQIKQLNSREETINKNQGNLQKQLKIKKGK